MVLRFEEWLTTQQYREDPIGDLARDPNMQNVEHKPTRRKFDEHKSWANIVIEIANQGHIAVFNEAWKEFLLAKRAAMDAAD